MAPPVNSLYIVYMVHDQHVLNQTANNSEPVLITSRQGLYC